MNHNNVMFEWTRLQMESGPALPYSQYERRAMLRAHKLFSTVRRRSGWYRLWAGGRKKSPQLYSLYAITGKRPLLLRQMSGLQMVRLSDIQDSEEKSDEFDHAFRPLRERNRARWVSVALARALGQSLPPVDLIRVGDIYFVRDGHHRVSVARAYGQKEIEANVLVLQGARAPSRLLATSATGLASREAASVSAANSG